MELKKLSRISVALLMIFQLSILPVNRQTAQAAEDVSVMEAVDSTYEFIRELEGFSCECVWDVNQWTIGYGTKCPYEHNCNGSYQHQKGGHVITEEQGRELVKDLMSYFVNTVRSNCKGLSMEQNQFDALVSAAYNHGNVNACPLKYYLQGTLSAEDARAQYLNWYVLPGSMYEAGLRNRRKKEADLFFGDTTANAPVSAPVVAEDSCSEEYAGTYTTKGVTSYLNLRSESAHSLSGAIIGKIYPNEIFTVTKANGAIAHVNYNGLTGIVCMDYIQRVPEEPAQTAELADGDVNSDNVVDGRDASAVLSDYSKISAGKSSELNANQQKAADANKDGVLDGRDATTILSYYAQQSAGGSGTISEYLASLNA